ncbi:PP2C family protein-serine/threonine phosphatase [Salinibacterium hongtaonis]|uniref:PP2C family protein-serine/threonine phosphatase n=1 Tax=Homoserinimonas hongtaonis TaxID=2079791 RepID=UPI000D38FAF1|nr:protein phosphatase 2C domain-containing protein [Salinibacterium hongtaonis]AWB88844.1 serine/threonine-protein phosphatase [Salinibacterium hongtaonis]
MTEIGQTTGTVTVTLPDRSGDSVTLGWAAATDTGRRRAHNEDSYVVDVPMFAVADGMGGHSAGDRASAAVVERLAEVADGGFGKRRDVEAALKRATKDISHVVDPEHRGVGTTVTGALLALVDGQAGWTIFNVGDSRTYLFQDDVFEQVTIDHSVVQELVDAGLLDAADAESHPDSNIITRAVGFNAAPVPDFWRIRLHTGMRLLLCSDGLTKEVDDATIGRQVRSIADREVLVETLVGLALEAGGRDNVTVVVVDVIDAPGGAASDSGSETDDVEADSDDDEDFEDDSLDEDHDDTIPRSGSAPTG